jgi:hypothetical protein
MSITIIFRPVPGNWRTSPDQRLRGLLKVALRAFGFRAERITESTTQAERGENVSPGVRTAQGANKAAHTES